MEHLHTLIQRGWTPEEAAHTRELLAREKYLSSRRETQPALYWGAVGILSIANALIGLLLVPVLVVAAPIYTALILFIIGGIIGVFFHVVINDIEHIDRRHRMLAHIIIPLTAVVTIFVMTAMANAAAARFQLAGHQEPFWMIISYVVAFLLPSLASEWFSRSE